MALSKKQAGEGPAELFLSATAVLLDQLEQADRKFQSIGILGGDDPVSVAAGEIQTAVETCLGQLEELYGRLKDAAGDTWHRTPTGWPGPRSQRGE